MKRKSWLLEQFKIARQQVKKWSPTKRRVMKNAVRNKPKDK